MCRVMCVCACAHYCSCFYPPLLALSWLFGPCLKILFVRWCVRVRVRFFCLSQLCRWWWFPSTSFSFLARFLIILVWRFESMCLLFYFHVVCHVSVLQLLSLSNECHTINSFKAQPSVGRRLAGRFPWGGSE